MQTGLVQWGPDYGWKEFRLRLDSNPGRLLHTCSSALKPLSERGSFHRLDIRRL